MRIRFELNIISAIVLSIFVLISGPIQADNYKVLVVMSYEEDNPWCMEIKEGIDSILSDTSDVTYFYMDTKLNIEGGPEKAGEAYALFQQIQPDGVITADDNAQRLFVLPYLQNHPETPIMFCAVNAEAEQYGFPTSNVSGILERGHIRESIALAKQLLPSLKTIAFLTNNSPSGEALLRQVQSESDNYLATTSFHLINSVQDLSSIDKELDTQADAIYLDSIRGIKDSAGNAMSYRDIVKLLTEQYRKPIIGANQYHVEEGALCAVIKTGQEQGSTAAKMLLDAMQGISVEEIPIARNFKGKRVINVTALEAFNLRVRPIVLLGAKLIKSAE